MLLFNFFSLSACALFPTALLVPYSFTSYTKTKKLDRRGKMGFFDHERHEIHENKIDSYLSLATRAASFTKAGRRTYAARYRQGKSNAHALFGLREIRFGYQQFLRRRNARKGCSLGGICLVGYERRNFFLDRQQPVCRAGFGWHSPSCGVFRPGTRRVPHRILHFQWGRLVHHAQQQRCQPRHS